MVICDDWSEQWVLATATLAINAMSILGLGFALAGWDREHSLQWDWLPLQRVDLDCWLFDIEAYCCSELGCPYSKLEIRCSKTFTRHGEWPLLRANVMYDVMLNCWVDMLMYVWWGLLVMTMLCILYTLVHLHKHTHLALPMKAWIVMNEGNARILGC